VTFDGILSPRFIASQLPINNHLMNSRHRQMTIRFTLNMERIHSLVKLIHSGIDPLKATGLGQSSGPRAEILRAIVVFLHATFEDVLRSGSPPHRAPLNFNAAADITKALNGWGLETAAFRPLYPALTQMAKRRHRIVHEADLPKKGAPVLADWNVSDEWQLIMWMTAVPTFYWQLHSSLDPGNEGARETYIKLRQGMDGIIRLGEELLALLRTPRDFETALQNTRPLVASLARVIATLSAATARSALDRGTSTPR